MTRDTVILVMALGYPPCLFLGYLFGRLTRAAVAIEENMDDAEDATPDAEQAAPVVPRPRVTPMRVLALVVVLIGVATIALGIIVTTEQAEAEARDDRLTACITGYSNALAEAFDARSSATTATSAAVDHVMEAIGLAFADAPAVGRDRVLQAITDYNKARAAARKTQAENPLPEAPRDACAELIKEE